MSSDLEDTFAWQVRATQCPAPVREYKFAVRRRWRFDFAWPDQMLAMEIEGGTWSGGRHTTGKGFAADCAKYNCAVMDGWRVLRFTGESVIDGSAIALVEQALKAVA